MFNLSIRDPFSGFLFFPGEAPTGDKLRLQLRDVDNKELHNMVLDL